jgi:hypothetical protein
MVLSGVDYFGRVTDVALSGMGSRNGTRSLEVDCGVG